MNVNPDEVFAYGAGVFVAKLSGNINKSIQDLVLLDVTPLSLGVEVDKNVMSVVIPRNTPIPTKKEKTYYTTYDNQTKIEINVYQGERSRSTDNHLLGNFLISGIPPAPKRVSAVTECFELDANGILTVTAEIVSTGMMKKLTITNETGRLSKKAIEKMVNDAAKYKHEDQVFKKKVEAYNALENCIFNITNKIKEYDIKIVHPESLNKMENAIAKTNEWLLVNGQAATVDELQSMEVYLKLDGYNI